MNKSSKLLNAFRSEGFWVPFQLVLNWGNQIENVAKLVDKIWSWEQTQAHLVLVQREGCIDECWEWCKALTELCLAPCRQDLGCCACRIWGAVPARALWREDLRCCACPVSSAGSIWGAVPALGTLQGCSGSFSCHQLCSLLMLPSSHTKTEPNPTAFAKGRKAESRRNLAAVRWYRVSLIAFLSASGSLGMRCAI